jgi:hypothetical protein
MKNTKTNPHALNASRTLRDYLKHEQRAPQLFPREAEKNTLCFCAGFLAQTGLTVAEMQTALAELQAEITIEENRYKTDWIARLKAYWQRLTLFHSKQ